MEFIGGMGNSQRPIRYSVADHAKAVSGQSQASVPFPAWTLTVAKSCSPSVHLFDEVMYKDAEQRCERKYGRFCSSYRYYSSQVTAAYTYLNYSTTGCHFAVGEQRRNFGQHG